MIFDWRRCCALAETRELQGEAPLSLDGGGLWVGVLSSGRCLIECAGAINESGASGDLLLARGTPVLRPITPCHLLCVRLTGLVVEEFLQGLPGPRFADSAAAPNAAELLARLCSTDPADPAAGAAAYQLLCALGRADEEVHPLPPLVAEAVAAIRNNYMALYGVEELSAQLGVSKCHLVRVFSAAMGVSPGRYLTGVRIEAAKLLLMERTYSLDMIASLCGFSGANYLCRVFKREVGVSPVAWRETSAPHAAPKALPARNNEIYV